MNKRKADNWKGGRTTARPLSSAHRPGDTPVGPPHSPPRRAGSWRTAASAAQRGPAQQQLLVSRQRSLLPTRARPGTASGGTLWLPGSPGRAPPFCGAAGRPFTLLPTGSQCRCSPRGTRPCPSPRGRARLRPRNLRVATASTPLPQGPADRCLKGRGRTAAASGPSLLQ